MVLLLSIVAVLWPALAGTALAWTALPGLGGSLQFQAANGEANDVTVSFDPLTNTFTFTDAGATVTSAPMSPCMQTSPNTVVCDGTGVVSIAAVLGDMSDIFVLEAPTPSFVQGGGGNDVITGGLGHDDIRGDEGNDELHGRDGPDTLVGERIPNDDLPGLVGGNTLDGGAGADTLEGGRGSDTMEGGDDADTLSGYSGDDPNLSGGAGADVISGGAGNDSMLGGPGDDQLGADGRVGGGGLFVERGDDSLDGGPGDDMLGPGSGPLGGEPDNDTLSGGEGADVVTYDKRDARVEVSIDSGANDGSPGIEADNVGLTVETVLGGRHDDLLTGSAAGDTLDGREGSDVLQGLAGDDVLDGGSAEGGNDDLDGGAGNDRLLGNAGNDKLLGDAGADTLMGGGDADTISGGSEDDAVTGGPGADRLDGGSGNDNVDGSQPFLMGVDGVDTIDGGPGNDILAGGDGDDTLAGGPGLDAMGGGPGRDTADYNAASLPVTVSLDGDGDDGQPGESDNVKTDIENVDGSGVQDTFTGNDNTNKLDGAAGEDYLDGARGKDDLHGGTAIDVLRARDDTVDTVDCGRSDDDFAIVDRRDKVSRNCERKDRGIRNRPQVGKEIVIHPVGGTNEFGLPAMDRTVPLKDQINVPLASRIDARGGSVRVTSAGRGRRRQAGVFSKGRFSVHQRRSRRPTTEIRLTGAIGTCGKRKRRDARAAAVSRVVRARFTLAKFPRRYSPYRIRAYHSVTSIVGSRSARLAAAGGTIVEVEDTCRGTVTRVLRGRVIVVDRDGRHVVRAGRRHLARR